MPRHCEPPSGGSQITFAHDTGAIGGWDATASLRLRRACGHEVILVTVQLHLDAALVH